MKLLKLVKKHLFKIILTIIGIILLILTVFALNGGIKADKDKKYRTFLERDHTTIVCNKGEKIGKMKIRYKTKDNKNLQKYTILLYCTNEPNLENNDNFNNLYSIALSNFYYKYKEKMNLYSFNIEHWIYGYSKEWDKKYPDNYFIN